MAITITSFPAVGEAKATFRTRLLKRAAARGDSVELQRAADLLGVAGLRKTLAAKDQTLQRAAIAASVLANQSWFLLSDLLELARRPAFALQAIKAARRISEQVTRRELARHEEGRNTMRGHMVQLLGIIRDTRLAIDVREAGLLTLAQLRSVLPSKDSELLALLKLPQPRLRKAAIEIFAKQASATAISAMAGIVASDLAVEVSRAAAARLCAQVSAGDGTKILATMKSSGAAAKLAELALSKTATVDEIADIARCLRKSKARGDRDALRKLRRRKAVRRAIYLVR